MRKVALESACITSYDWVEYFYRNAPEPILPWSDSVRLSGAERLAVISSIQQFQLGEGASGSRMVQRAQRFSKATGDLGLIAALKLFLREERRHSHILARFLQVESAPCLRRHWIHSAFRWIRGLAGLELCLKVLVTAELWLDPTMPPCEMLQVRPCSEASVSVFSMKRVRTCAFKPSLLAVFRAGILG